MLILHHANIHSTGSSQPVGDALAIQGEHIYAIGESEDILSLADRNSKIIDLQGKTILPGLIDSHIHLLQYGLKLSNIDCETESKQECLRRISKKAQDTPVGTWIQGQGWNHNIWEDEIGTKEDLDAISTEHPIYLAAKSLHASWANSKALALAGINKITPDPEGGKIERDANGDPTGILLKSAVALVEKVIPAPNDRQKKDALLKGQSHLFEYGITGVHDVDEWSIYPLLRKMKIKHEFPLRIVKSIPFTHLQDAIADGITTGMGNNDLRIGWLKLFMDGALGPQTAAMLDPYAGSPDQYGMLMLSTAELKEIGELAARNGISLAVHAIGDRAIRLLMNGIEQIRSTIPPSREKIPDRIEHVQIIHPDDIQRMASLGLLASMQPIHVVSDMETAEKYWGNRCAYSYAWNSIEKAGIPLLLGSDAPVESPNPFLGIHACVARQNSRTGKEWFPSQSISLSSALKGYSSFPGAIFMGSQPSGVIKAGALADLIILPDDPFSISSSALRDIEPCATMVGGKFVWESPVFLQK